MKKYYCVYSGIISDSVKPIVYKYANTSNIQLRISRKGFSIEVFRTVKKAAHELSQDPLFKDALKKVTKIQLIKYGELLKGTVLAQVGEEKTKLYEQDAIEIGSTIYCMCGERLKRRLVNNWKDFSIQRVADVPKSRTGRLDAALDALLMAKSKEYETEKFIYLWMGMNGLYGYTAEIAKDYMPSKNELKWIKNEFAQLKFFSMINDYRYTTVGKEQEQQIIRKIEFVLSKIRADQISELKYALKICDEDNEIVKNIQNIFLEFGIEQGKMHPYVALLLYTSYKIRCKYFHAVNTIPLICFENEHPIPVLRILNTLMEEYLDCNLNRWFDRNVFESIIRPRIVLLAENCRCDKNGHLISCVVNNKEMR